MLETTFTETDGPSLLVYDTVWFVSEVNLMGTDSDIVHGPHS